MIHLQAVNYLGNPNEEYPFSLPIIANLSSVSFEAPITFFVGENGSGKSTLLEGLAAMVRLPVIGSLPIADDPSLVNARSLAKQLKPKWQSKPQRGFFLRAEDFFGFVKGINQQRQDLIKDMQVAEAEAEHRGASSYAISMTKMSFQGGIAALSERYGVDLDAASHGESFLKLLKTRIVKSGLYLLDEPEAALSPMRQLALIALLQQFTREENCQFIIATHSPILLAFPHAQIMLFEENNIQQVKYDDLEHVSFTRDFLRDPQVFLRFLSD